GLGFCDDERWIGALLLLLTVASAGVAVLVVAVNDALVTGAAAGAVFALLVGVGSRLALVTEPRVAVLPYTSLNSPKGPLSPYAMMRTRAGLAAIVVACACGWGTGVAHAGGGPGAVYNDFAQDGKLSCNHSRGDLEAVLRSGSLNQYGDPLRSTASRSPREW